MKKNEETNRRNKQRKVELGEGQRKVFLGAILIFFFLASFRQVRTSEGNINHIRSITSLNNSIITLRTEINLQVLHRKATSDVSEFPFTSISSLSKRS